MLANEQAYLNEQYEDNHIQKRTLATVRTLNRYTKDIQNYALEKNSLESEETYTGDGIIVKSASFYRLTKSASYNDGFFNTSFGGFQIEMSLNEIEYSRSIYSVLDLLGDVGGLYSIFLDFGNIIIATSTFLFGSLMDQYLKSSIFKAPNEAS